MTKKLATSYALEIVGSSSNPNDWTAVYTVYGINGDDRWVETSFEAAETPRGRDWANRWLAKNYPSINGG